MKPFVVIGIIVLMVGSVRTESVQANSKAIVKGRATTMQIKPTETREAPKRPRIVGEWWRVASNPDLGALTSPQQQPVDFGVWQAADGSWQLWSCIRMTKEPGKTRLFYRWEGANLTDTDWKPMGIAMHADPALGETRGGLQAPYVFRDHGQYWMFYGDWEHICSATSEDGKAFKRRVMPDGRTALFSLDAETNRPSAARTSNTRDPMVIRVGDLWICYFTAFPHGRGAVYCCTSHDLATWSEPREVASGGQSGDGPSSSECPFVVELSPGEFYLFRNQLYGQNARCSVYYSRDPYDFGINHDEGHFVCTLPCAAPEIIHYQDRYYIAALLPSLQGIQIARLEWVSQE